MDPDKLIDPFGRHIGYLRVSVTDRCDFRCIYCMAETMQFLPKHDLLTLEELERLCAVFINCGIQKIRLTGGEPLVRKNIMQLIAKLGHSVRSGKLEELTMTTNGSRLRHYASQLFDCGIKRINVSLDTLNPELFKKITRNGDLAPVLEGIKYARQIGLAIKINTVALKDLNEHELLSILAWAHGEGLDLTIIETMPLGDIDGDRTAQYLPLSVLQSRLQQFFHLEAVPHKTGGPARYFHIRETGGLLGLITPLTHNFCESCNRIRLTCTGTLFMCLGQEVKSELRAHLRSSKSDEQLYDAITEAIARKPKGHDFIIDETHNKPALARHMSVTGG